MLSQAQHHYKPDLTRYEIVIALIKIIAVQEYRYNSWTVFMCQSFSWAHDNDSLLTLIAIYGAVPINASFHRTRGVRMSSTNFPICHGGWLPFLLGHVWIEIVLIFQNMRIHATKWKKKIKVSYFNFVSSEPRMLIDFNFEELGFLFKGSTPTFY